MAKRTLYNLPKFEKGDPVWLDGKNLNTQYESRKLGPKWEGPFKIIEKMGKVTYKLELPKQWKIHPVFHASLLKPYKEMEIHGPNYTRPPPDLIKGEQEYEVEMILNSWQYRGRMQYLVKWKGYSLGENSWEDKENLANAWELLNAFKG